jgi:hypothetical protein
MRGKPARNGRRGAERRGKRRRRQAAQSEAGGDTELAAEETENGDTAANEVAGGTGRTAPERETEPAAGQVAPFTASA